MATSESKFIFITLTLAILLGIPTFYSIFEPSVDSQNVRATLQTKVNSLKESVGLANQSDSRIATRSPASVKKPEVSTILKRDLFCDSAKIGNAKGSIGPAKNRAKFRTKNDFIQLSGKTCLKKLDPKNLNVVNKTNGYTGSFFSLEEQNYQTDLIRLQSGKNIIEFEVVGPGNQSEVNSIEVNAELPELLDSAL